MRPVIRGNPANYNEPDTDGGVVAARKVQADLIALNNKRTDIENAVLQYTYQPLKVRQSTKKDIENSTLNGLQQAQPALEQALRNAINSISSNPPTDNEKKAVNNAAKALMYNLNLQFALLWKLYMEIIDGYLAGKYSKSRGDLIQNIGQYCSYCEMPLAASLAVEHMLPKADFPVLSLNWNNFLLACPSCNSRKSNTPSLSAATDAARQAKGSPDVTEQEIIQAGYNMLLWPTDTAPRYPGFTQTYHYRLEQVAYDDGGNRVNSRQLSPERIARLMARNGLFLDGEPAEDIIAVIYDYKFDMFPSPELVTLGGILNNIPADGQEVNATTGFPDSFLHSLREEVGMDISDTSYAYGLKQGLPYGNATGATLVEQRRYSVNTSRANAVVTNLKTGQQVTAYNTETGEPLLLTSMELLGPLQASVLPNDLAVYLGLSPFEWVTVIEQPGRTEYHITLTRQVALLQNGNNLQARLFSTSAVELILLPNAPASGSSTPTANYFAAGKTVKLTGLNDRASRNPEDSDRRVIKRTRAFFTALQTAGDVHQAFNLSTDTYPSIRADALQAARITMIATGYWSVWLSVILQFMSVNNAARDPLLALLYDVGNFPGTRP